MRTHGSREGIQVEMIKLFTATFAVSLTLTSPVWAQSLEDSTDPAATPAEPTTVEELAPSGAQQSIPGTEPLYDKGITVTEIEIQGNKLVPSDEILSAITTKPGTLYSKKKLQNDLKTIYDLGYFTDKIRVVPIATRDGVFLRFEVEENPTVTGFAFEGVKEVPEADLTAIFQPQVGKPQNVTGINKGIQQVEQYYKDKGYILARVDDINEDTPGVINLKVNEGVVNKITFTGNKKTREYVIRRAMAQKSGDVYNEKTVAEDLKRIFAVQSFSDVRRVVKASADTPGEYDVVIEVDEKKTGTLTLGGGIDTGTGIFGSVGYSDANFLGRGQNVSTVFSVGSGVFGTDRDTLKKRVIQAQANWFTPSLNETNNSLGVSLYARDLASFNVPLAIERRFGGEVDYGHPFEKYPGLSTLIGVGVEDINIREGTTPARLAEFGVTPAERMRELEDGTYAFVTPTLSFDSRDNRFNPSSGWLNTVGAKLAFGIQNDTYGTLNANLRRYLRVTDNVSLALNAQGGTTVLGDLPQFNQFRMGGSFTVRGFQEGGIGTGDGFALASAELRSRIPLLKRFTRYPIYDLVQAAFFVDGGSLFGEPITNQLFGRPGSGYSIGAGIRANLPALGPIRIDYAVPFSGSNGSNTRRINFGVGQKF